MDHDRGYEPRDHVGLADVPAGAELMGEDRLDRLERKLDQVANDVVEIKLAFAEYKGARKAVYAIATFFGALAGVAATFFTRRAN
jgi:hypothetical protein